MVFLRCPKSGDFVEKSGLFGPVLTVKEAGFDEKCLKVPKCGVS